MSLRVAIAGAGFIGAVHAHAVRAAGGRVVAVLASTPERSEAAARRLGAERAASGVEELVGADDVDVVHVCTPNHLHDEIADAALVAGKHVVCEKPLAVDLERAERLAARAGSTPGRLAVVPFAYRYYPLVHEARRRIASGDTGAVHLIHGTYLQDWLLSADDANWRVDAGARRRVPGVRRHRLPLVRPGRVRDGPPRGAALARAPSPRCRSGGRAGNGPAFAREDGRGEPRAGGDRGRRRRPVRDRRRGARRRGRVAGVGGPQEPPLAGGGRRPRVAWRSTRRTPRRCGAAAATRARWCAATRAS